MPDLGTKHECYNCGTKFYDLGKSPALCPKCGADQSEAKREEALEAAEARRRRREAARLKPVAEALEEEPLLEEEHPEAEELEEELIEENGEPRPDEEA